MAAGPATMTEGLGKVLQDISSTMSTPDADIQFLTQLQGIIVGRMRAGSQPPQAAGGPPPGAGGPPAGGPPGSTPGAPGPSGPPDASGGPAGPGPDAGPPPGSQLQGPPSPNGVTPLAKAPDPDELRRMIQGHTGA